MEKHEKRTEETGRVPSTELRKDHRSYLEGQGNKHGRVEMNWTEAAARYRIGERRFRFARHILRMAPERPAHSARLDTS